MNFLNIVKSKNIDGNFLLLKNDNSISPAILKGNRYQEWILKWAEKYIRKNTNVLDIGANFGSNTLAFSKIVKSNGNGYVHSFEPQRVIYQQLCCNIVNNNMSNVCTHNFGLSNINDEKEMYVLDFFKDGNFGNASLDDVISNMKEKIKVVTLDSLNLKNISFIKVDIQSHEYQFLKGAKNTLKTNNNIYIILELPIKTKPQILIYKKCNKFMLELGYKQVERHNKDVLYFKK